MQDTNRQFPTIRDALADDGFCPECLAMLDEDEICTQCGYDALSLDDGREDW